MTAFSMLLVTMISTTCATTAPATAGGMLVAMKNKSQEQNHTMTPETTYCQTRLVDDRVKWMVVVTRSYMLVRMVYCEVCRGKGGIGVRTMNWWNGDQQLLFLAWAGWATHTEEVISVISNPLTLEPTSPFWDGVMAVSRHAS